MNIRELIIRALYPKPKTDEILVMPYIKRKNQPKQGKTIIPSDNGEVGDAATSASPLPGQYELPSDNA